MGNYFIVTETSSNIRALARESLRGRWGFAGLATLLYFALLLVPSLILTAFFGGEDGTSAIATIYDLLIAGPMLLGYSTLILSLLRKRPTSISDVLSGFEYFGKALGLYLVMVMFIMLWSLLFIIPGIIATYRYSMAFFILADNPNMNILDCLNESKRMMIGNKGSLFFLHLTFIGWGLLSALTLGIGSVWLVPYMQVAQATFYDMANGSLRRIDQNGPSAFYEF